MAEFVQTIKDWRRMCADINCSECEIFNYCQGLPNADAYADKIERIVTAWAAEHPEPVYPTWAEWLESMHVITVTPIKGCMIRKVLPAFYMFSQIPADIAQKLGIEPKEGE